MHFEKKYALNFQHHKKKYQLSVDQLCLPEDNAIFKVEMLNFRYWLIRSRGKWKFIAEDPPDGFIRRLLIKKINVLYSNSKISGSNGSYGK